MNSQFPFSRKIQNSSIHYFRKRRMTHFSTHCIRCRLVNGDDHAHGQPPLPPPLGQPAASDHHKNLLRYFFIFHPFVQLSHVCCKSSTNICSSEPCLATLVVQCVHVLVGETHIVGVEHMCCCRSESQNTTGEHSLRLGGVLSHCGESPTR